MPEAPKRDRAINSQLQAYCGLQRIDSILDTYREKEEELKKAIQEQNDLIRQHETQRAVIDTEIRELMGQAKIAELDVQSIESRIENLFVQRNGLRNNRDYQAMTEEIRSAQADRSRAEERGLEILSRLDEKRKERDDIDARIQEARESREAKEQETAEARAEIERETETHREERSAFEAQLDEEEQDLYERLREGREGMAVAEVVDGVCQGCYMSLTPQIANLVLGGRTVARCQSCRRILRRADSNEV